MVAFTKTIPGEKHIWPSRSNICKGGTRSVPQFLIQGNGGRAGHYWALDAHLAPAVHDPHRHYYAWEDTCCLGTSVLTMP